MNQRNASMTVIGAGSYGTALAITLARNGHEVVLWAMTLNISQRLNATAVTPRFSPMCLFPIRSILKAISATALAASRNILASYPAMSW